MFAIIKYFIISLFLSIATACYLLCCTPGGLQYELRWLAQRLPGHLTIKEIDGTLFSGFTLKNIVYDTPDYQAHVKTLRVTWHPEQLLHRKIAIEHLLLEETKITLSNSQPANTQLTLDLHFLQHITLNHLVIQDLLVEKSKLAIRFNGEMTDKWNIQWKIHIPELHELLSEVSGFLESSGTISGPRMMPTIHTVLQGKQLSYAEQTIGQLQGQADIEVKPHTTSTLQLVVRDVTLHEQLFKKLNLAIKGNVAFANHDLATALSINIDKNSDITASLKLPDFTSFTNPEQHVDGTVAFNSTNLEALRYLSTEIKHPHGRLQGSLHITGTISQPILMGDFQLNEGTFSLPFLGIQPEKIHLQGHLDHTKLVTLSGHFRSADGDGKLQGRIDLAQTALPSVFMIQGSHLKLVNLPEYKVSVSPDLTLDFAYPTLQLKGKMTITEADIRPKNFDETQTLPDEIVFINEKTTTPNFNLDTILKLDLHLGNHINVNYDSLQTSLGGNISIIKDSDSPATARGELYAVKGKYAAYGQKLTIDTGRLIYTGNQLMNPGLDIVATKKVRRVTASNPNDLSTSAPSLSIYTGTEMIAVGIRINGTLDHPQISLYSMPTDLNQGDILSYLILGYPQSNATGNQGTAILGALTSLYPGNNISNLTEKIEKKFGLTELNVGSVQSFNPISQKIESNTAFMVGKQITNKLSIHYSVGLFDPVYILNLRYQLNNHWAVQSETSTIDNGADLVYVFERD